MYDGKRSRTAGALVAGMVVLILICAAIGGAVLILKGWGDDGEKDEDPGTGAPEMPGDTTDSDGDGIIDVWEEENGLDPLDPVDAALDKDDDGESNLEEYLGDDGEPYTGDETDPGDPLDHGIERDDIIDPGDETEPPLTRVEPLRMEDAGTFMRTATMEELERLADLEGSSNFTNVNPGDYRVSDGNTTGGAYEEGDGAALGGGDGDSAQDAPGAGDENKDSNDGGGSEREVEEADIIKVSGDYLYLLNPYRGLLVIDISDPDDPVIKGRARVLGYPVDMYVVDSQAYIGVRMDYSFWYTYWLMGGAEAGAPVEYQIGSQILVVNMFDPEDPVVVDTIELEGQLTDTRRVGDVIYAVSTCGWSYRYYIQDGEAEDTTYVVSINVADPYDVYEVERVEFPGSSSHIHASPTALFVGQPEYHYEDEWVDGEPEEVNRTEESEGLESETPQASESGGGSDNGTATRATRQSYYTTGVTYVDIEDPQGDIKVRDTFAVDGYLQDRFSMDHHKDSFRIVTHFWDGIGESVLWTFDVSEPDNVEAQGSLEIDDAGSLMATRFAGERAYTIHLPRSVDPLDVLDLSDPYEPELCDVFEMPGWVEHMEVRGYKILALGVDDSEGTTNVAVSLFDVTDPYNVVMEERVRIGEGYTWSTANWDDKALSVVDEEGIILVPYDSYGDSGWYGQTSGVQIVEFDLVEDTLTLRGSIDHMDTVKRTRVHNGRLILTSNRAVQVVDASDRDDPEVTAALELYVNVRDTVKIGGACVQLVYRDWDEPMELRTVDFDDPDSTAGEATVELDAQDSRMWVRGDYIIVLANRYDYEVYEHTVFLNIYDYFDPYDPTLVTSMELPVEYYSFGYYYCEGAVDGIGGYGYYGGGNFRTYNEAMMLEGGTLVLHPSSDYYYYWYYDDHYYGDYGRRGTREGTPTQNQTLYMVDLSDPADARLMDPYVFESYPIYNMMPGGNMIYYTQMEWMDDYQDGYHGAQEIRYSLGRIDLADPETPVKRHAVNIPGVHVGANKAGTVVYTVARWWMGEGEEAEALQTINALTLDGGMALLESAVLEVQNIRGLVVDDTKVYYCLGPQYYYWYWYYDGWSEEVDDVNTVFSILDFEDPADPVRTGTTEASGNGDLMGVWNGHAFFRMDYGNGILIYDVSQPGDPVLLGLYLTQGYADIKVYQDRVHILQGNYGVMTVFFSDGHYE